jgi:cytochrome P450
MAEQLSLPSYRLRPDPPSLWDMLRSGISDPASVFPAAILDQPALQLPGPGAPLLIADPALVREVLNDREGRFTGFKLMRRLLRRAWGKGLAAADGEDWQRQRRAGAPAFRPAAVEANCAAFAAAASKAAANWPQGEPVELTELAARIIADIVFTTLIGGFATRDLLPFPETWHDRLAGLPGDPAVLRVATLAKRLARQQQEKPGPESFIGLLEGNGPLEDNIRGLFPAAMETTVSGVSWALYTLALRPDWQARVAAEAHSCGEELSLDRLPLTRRVVQEVLRLYPPAPVLARSAARDGELGGFPLRKGQPVSIHIYAMHRHRTLWEHPDAFDPDRFMPERGTHPGWLPFGAGPRVCIAAQFALAEIAVVVARLLAELQLTPAGLDPLISLQVTTKSLTGLTVIADRRT